MKKFSFIHAADLHLGYQQYGLIERFRDYGDAFSEVCDFAIHKDVDFLLVSGDIFDDRNINAMTFSQSYQVLKKLSKNDVPVFAIEGNHDKAYYSEGMSWLEALDYQGLLNLLKIESSEFLDILGDFRELEIKGELIRIFGVKYVGARTKEVIPKIKDEIKEVDEKRGEADYNILMMHFGLEDQTKMNLGRGYSYSKLLPLKEVVDYLALGHYHVAYEAEDWVFNPGSLEVTKMDEVGHENGFYYFNGEKVELKEVDAKRPLLNIRIKLEEMQSPKDAYEEVKSKGNKFDFSNYNKKPIVNLVFEGEIRFRRDDLPIEKSKEIFSDKAIYVNTKIDTEEEEIEFDDLNGTKKKKIERDVLEKLIRVEKPNLEDDASSISDSLLQIKDMAVNNSGSQKIIDALKSCYDNIDRTSDGNRKEEKKTWNWREAY